MRVPPHPPGLSERSPVLSKLNPRRDRKTRRASVIRENRDRLIAIALWVGFALFAVLLICNLVFG